MQDALYASGDRRWRREARCRPSPVPGEGDLEVTQPSEWTEDRWAEHREYADRTTVQVDLIEDHTSLETSDAKWLVIANGSPGDREWLVREVELLALDGTRRGQSEPATYLLDTVSRRTSWGADGATLEIVLGIASWAGSSLAWDALKAIALKLRERLKGGPVPQSESNLAESEAIERAYWIVAQRYKENQPELDLVYCEANGPSAVVRYRSDDTGWVYEVHLETLEGLVYTAMCKRWKAVPGNT